MKKEALSSSRRLYEKTQQHFRNRDFMKDPYACAEAYCFLAEAVLDGGARDISSPKDKIQKAEEFIAKGRERLRNSQVEVRIAPEHPLHQEFRDRCENFKNFPANQAIEIYTDLRSGQEQDREYQNYAVGKKQNGDTTPFEVPQNIRERDDWKPVSDALNRRSMRTELHFLRARVGEFLEKGSPEWREACGGCYAVFKIVRDMAPSPEVETLKARAYLRLGLLGSERSYGPGKSEGPADHFRRVLGMTNTSDPVHVAMREKAEEELAKLQKAQHWQAKSPQESSSAGKAIDASTDIPSGAEENFFTGTAVHERGDARTSIRERGTALRESAHRELGELEKARIEEKITSSDPLHKDLRAQCGVLKEFPPDREIRVYTDLRNPQPENACLKIDGEYLSFSVPPRISDGNAWRSVADNLYNKPQKTQLYVQIADSFRGQRMGRESVEYYKKALELMKKSSDFDNKAVYEAGVHNQLAMLGDSYINPQTGLAEGPAGHYRHALEITDAANPVYARVRQVSEEGLQKVDQSQKRSAAEFREGAPLDAPRGPKALRTRETDQGRGGFFGSGYPFRRDGASGSKSRGQNFDGRGRG